MQSQTELMEPRELMDEVLDVRGAQGRLARNAPNSDTRSTMVSLMGDNVGDDKW